MIFVTHDYINSINSYLNDGWIVSSVHPIANFVTGSSYSHGDWGAYVVLEKPFEYNTKECAKRYNEFLIETENI
jgi:hypothetical protein